MPNACSDRWLTRLSVAEQYLAQQAQAERALLARPRYPPDLQTEIVLLGDVFEVQSQRAFALMRQLGVEVPERDPERRRMRASDIKSIKRRALP